MWSNGLQRTLEKLERGLSIATKFEQLKKQKENQDRAGVNTDSKMIMVDC